MFREEGKMCPMELAISHYMVAIKVYIQHKISILSKKDNFN